MSLVYDGEISCSNHTISKLKVKALDGMIIVSGKMASKNLNVSISIPMKFRRLTFVMDY